MIKIPAFVKIGNIFYSVRFGEPEEMKKPDEGLFIHGHIDYGKCEIVLNPELPDQRLADTLVHEIVHGLFYEGGLDELNNERNVDGLTHILRRFLLENHVEWIRAIEPDPMN